MATSGVLGRLNEFAPVKVKRTAPGTYLVFRSGQDPITGIAIYAYSPENWECERCGSSRGTTRTDCEHVKLARKKASELEGDHRRNGDRRIA